MDVFVLLILAIVIIISYRYFFPNRQNPFRKSVNPEYLNRERSVVFREEKYTYSKEKGDDFEEFVLSLFDFQSKRFVLNEWRSDKYFEGIYPKSNHYPDFEILLQTKSYNSPFAVECKFRSNWSQDDTIQWAKEQQISNYYNYSKEKSFPVFIVLGIGGSPKDPNEVYIFSLNEVNYQFRVHYNLMQQFRRERANASLFYNAEYNILK